MPVVIVIVVILLAPLFVIYCLTKFGLKLFDACLLIFLVISFLFFWYGLENYRQDYDEQIDGFVTNYTPFANAHVATLFTFLAFSFVAVFVLWIKQHALPPLLLVVIASMTLIGIVINLAIVIQIVRKTNNLGEPEEDSFIFLLLPLAYLIISLVVLLRFLRSETKIAAGRTYKSPLLNRLNNLMAKAQWLWILLLALPLFLLVTLILVLFGQDCHAITKVFTETTTWNFSTKSHPPILDDHTGHYLCTVAACGDPAIVKPIGWGYRHGYPIPVNRQLQIANAFEELIQEKSPSLHRIIRNVYDRYGYPLSKRINSPSRSNITYRLMKPLEYFFLATLYFFCVNPEQKIAKQYSQ